MYQAGRCLYLILLIGIDCLTPLLAATHPSFSSNPDLEPLAANLVNQVELSDTEQAWLAQDHTVRARVGKAAPYHFLLDDQPQGISVDYFRLICQVHRMDCQFVTGIPWAETIQTLGQPNGTDVILTIHRTPERESQVAFTHDYLQTPWVIFRQDQGLIVTDIRDLEGREIAIERGFLMADILQQQYPNIRLRTVASTPKALEALAAGQVDGYIGNLVTGTYLIQELELSNVHVAAPTPFGYHSQAMGVRMDWQPLVSIINKTLDALSEVEHANIRQYWLAVRFEYLIDWATVQRVAISAVVLVILLLSVGIL